MRGDSLIALAIPTACVALLAEAYFRTDGDADAPANAQFQPSDLCIAAQSDDIVRELETNGIVVIPNAISRSVLRAARNDIYDFQRGTSSSRSLASSGFNKSANDEDIRQDTVAWISISNETTEGPKAGVDGNGSVGRDLEYCIRFLRGIPNALEQCGYSASRDHRVPRQCQLAMYQGDGEASYARHLDQCNASMIELGLLEWMRLSDYRERRITTILYLNEPDRPKSHGGALRCWVARARDAKEETSSVDSSTDGHEAFYPSFDIQPTGGTLVIFQSGRVDHQVMPSTVDRFALTNWVSSESECR